MDRLVEKFAAKLIAAGLSGEAGDARPLFPASPIQLRNS